MKILAIDPGTHCGWAHSDGRSGTWDLFVPDDSSGSERLLMFRDKLIWARKTLGVDAVAYELVTYSGPKMRGAGVQSELVGVLKVWCVDHHIAFAGFNLTTIKKFATGKGNAKKEQMLDAARLIWDDVGLADDNEIDARFILEYAKRERGAA